MQIATLVPQRRGAICVFRSSGQEPGLFVRFMCYGSADALRIDAPPLPVVGTWGIVAFPTNDIRNGVWLGSYYPAFQDAINASDSPADAFQDYSSHYSGAWSLTDARGQRALQHPDGSYQTVGSGAAALPVAYRHIVDSTGAQQRVPFPQSQRVPSPPSAYAIRTQHVTGTNILMPDVSGSVMASGATGAQMEFNFGGTTHIISPTGATTITGASNAPMAFNFGGTNQTIAGNGQTTFTGAEGAGIVINYGGTIVNVASNGAVVITLADGQAMTVNQSTGGEASGFVVLDNKMVDQFNNHTHPVTAAPGTTGVPTTPIAANDINNTNIGLNGDVATS